MSKVELSDAELIALADQYQAETPSSAATRIIHPLSLRLTARNAELDELRKVMERVSEAVDHWRKYPQYETIQRNVAIAVMDEALAPAQKEAPVERCGEKHPAEAGTICEHESFYTTAKIARLTDKEDGGPVTGYHIDIEVMCDDCKEPFHFVGIPMGMSLVGGAMVSVTGLVLNCKISPGKLELPTIGKATFVVNKGN